MEDNASQDRPIVIPPEALGALLLNRPLESSATRPSLIPVVRLRLHPVLERLGLTDLVEEINEAAQLLDHSAADPILITASGIILDGFDHWRLALLEGRQEVQCVEIPIAEEEVIPFILSHYKPWRGWNAFIRIQLALTLEPAFERRALDNMRAGGRHKGSANLPEAQHVDVRQQIAHAAGVGVRNVSNVKTLLNTAHPRLIAALREGTLMSNAAMQFCKLPKSKQLEHLILRSEERLTNKVIRRSIAPPKKQVSSPDAATIIDILRQQEACQPGSVVVRLSRCQHTVVLLGLDLLAKSHSHEELKLT